MGASAQWFLFLHILSVLWLTAGVLGGAVVRAQTRRSETLAEKVLGVRLGWRLMALFTLPGMLLAGVLGFGVLGMRRYPFDLLWVHLSLVLYVLMLALTLFYLAPAARRAWRAAEASSAAGQATPELEAALAAKLPGILADVNALGIVVLTLLMTVRP